MERVIDNLINAATELVGQHFAESRDDLAQALELCDGEVSISLALKTKNEKDGVRLRSKMGFTKEKVASEKSWLLGVDEPLPFPRVPGEGE